MAEKTKKFLARLTMPNFTAGVIVNDGRIENEAPKLRRSAFRAQMNYQIFKEYWISQGGKWEETPIEDDDV